MSIPSHRSTRPTTGSMGRRHSLHRHPSTSPRTPSFLAGSALFAEVSSFISTHANFYRVHLVAFICVPLIFSAIFYASNGDNHISYTDSLFMVFSSATVTGLSSVLLADLTLWQQVVLFLMMCIGSTSSVSLFTIVIRRHFFRRKFDFMIATSSEARHRINQVGAEETAKHPFYLNPFAHDPIHHPTMIFPSPAAVSRSSTRSTPDNSTPRFSSVALGLKKKKKKKKNKVEKLRADMVRRADLEGDQAVVEGWLEREKEAQRRGNGPVVAAVLTEEPLDESAIDDEEGEDWAPRGVREGEAAKASIQIDEPHKPDRNGPSSPRFRRKSLPRIKPTQDHQHRPNEVLQTPKHFPRSKTVEWGDEGAAPDSQLRLRRQRTNAIDPDFPRRRNSHSNVHDPHSRAFTRTTTYQPDTAMTTGYGGFPNPLTAAAGFVRRQLPAAIERSITMPRTTTLASTKAGQARTEPATKNVSYLTFDATVGRNSKFRKLTTAQQEELGGVEYRALTVLLRIVVGYWLLLQLVSVLILAPWLSGSGTYAPVFAAPDTDVNATWFTFFQVFSAFSNTGMSLVDASMVPFQRAYLLIVVMCFLILGGNTAFPVFLRFFIWIISKIVPSQSRTRETLQFLLDHPRRCFIYLFPSHQTWFLLFVLVVLNSIDWVSFLILDIGNPMTEAIPIGTRVIDGLFQAIAVRTAGFTIVTLADTAPALQLLYLIMMYIAVYPIAVSIRSTNVYEEKSMGVFESEDDEDEVEARFDRSASPTSYIAYHARKQLAFDMWWLVLAVWIICIIERTNIVDDSAPWISIFSIMFEVCSAYGTVGLSLGTPTKNTSLAGALRPLSRLVLIAVMIRGRHRGLPIAIDRAVLLPSDLVDHNDDAARSFVGTEVDPVDGEEGLQRVEPQTDSERVEAGGE